MSSVLPNRGEALTPARSQGQSRIRSRIPATCVLSGTLTAALVFVGGCDQLEDLPAEQSPATAANGAPAFAVEASATQGSSTLLVRASASELTVAERLVVECEVSWPAATAPQWPKELDSLNGFVTLDRSDSGPDPTPDGRFRFRRTLTLEPFLSGEREIPALSIDLPTEASPSASVPRLSSRPIAIEVAPVVADAPTKPDELIKALAGPSTLPASSPVVLSFWQRRSNLALLAGAVLLGGPLLVASVHLARRKRSVSAETPIEALHRLTGVLDSSSAGGNAQPLLDDIANQYRLLLSQRLGDSAISASMTELSAPGGGLQLVLDEPVRSAATAVAGALDRARFASDPSDRRAAALAIASALRTFIEHWPAQPMGTALGGQGSIA